MNTKKTTSAGNDPTVDTVSTEIDPAAIIANSGKKSNGNGNGNIRQKSKPAYAGSDSEPELDRRELLRILSEVKNGNFNVRMPIDLIGIDGKICDTLNDIIYLNEKLMEELTRAGKTIGKQGKLNHRVELPFAKGSWNTGLILSIT
jgi:hypothetical protein